MNTTVKNKSFSQIGFMFFIINFVVGFGFISTILSVLNLKVYGLLVIIITSLITLGVVLLFSRLAAKFSAEYGSSYYYAKQIKPSKFAKHFTFLNGWMQFIQGPILSAAAPLFIADAISVITNNSTIISIIRAISFIFYIILIFVSTFGLKLNGKIILASAIVKWLTLFLALSITIYLAFVDHQFNQNLQTNNKVNIYLIITTVIAFMNAFGGFESLAGMTKEVKTNNVRKILFIAFGFIFSFYLIFYLVILGINSQTLNGQFSNIFKRVWSITGLVVFVIGTIFNQISSKLSYTVVNARLLIPLAEDNYLPRFLVKRNKYGEFSNAIYFSLVVTIFSLVVFWLIPEVFKIGDFLISVINIGTVAYLLQYILTFVCAFILEKQEKIERIPLWEKIIYSISFIALIVLILSYLFPFILFVSWSIYNTITFVSFIVAFIFGYALYFWANRK
ncbi:amino acid permease [Mycoplasmopsis pullorum]|uniref:APC family permease n=2 Tax=Mycoplasmopsis pullorum TaxID=48003 RepID=UPI00111A60D7|nr:APC family permease [Mycoplasmopsis pullorum]TNK82540.1 amino acid permease [Mycoplasmopsis pullorum]TNK83322.1 amino acid permease [Mycoplasmopsis pullorum]TNK84489.1 amino acid permease [Mycoplasmopsis pullorum]TNK84732.1 amino acid permease [Mycoplasmopsis pullorum]TNK86322.1 amino acid permease [Mycoplasmopsis pullorum]